MKNKVVIITGASSGIGLATAWQFAKSGSNVVLAARKLEILSSIVQEMENRGLHAMAVQTDVAVEEDCKQLIEKTIDKYGKIDVLINNAGLSMRAIFNELDLDVFERLMKVNFLGSVYCTRYAINELIKSKGSVVGVSSIAGYVGLPARTAYSASKYALQGFLDALRTENRKTGLHVLVACPGYTASNIRKTALTSDGTSQDESPLEEGKIMSAEEVASSIYHAVKKRKRTLVLTFEGKMAVFLSKFFPGFIEKMVFKKVSSEPGSPIPQS